MIENSDHNFILGLFGLDTVYDYPPDLDGLFAVLTSKGGAFVETGFPEFGPHAKKRCNTLKDALAACRGRIRCIVNIPLNQFHRQEDLYGLLQRKLDFFGLEAADICLFGPVSGYLLEELKNNGFAGFLEDAVERGLVKQAGIWLFDRVEYVEVAAALSPHISMLRFDYSPLDYIDWPGAYAFVAAEKNGLIPAAGGADFNRRLIRHTPENVERLWQESGKELSLKEQMTVWAVQEAKGNTVIFHADTPDELSRLFDLAKEAEGTRMNVRDMLLRNNLKDELGAARPVDCTACGCCMPCEAAGIDIPGILALYNEAMLYDEEKIPICLFHLLGHDRKQCTACGQCCKYCPRRNKIPKIMEYVGRWWE